MPEATHVALFRNVMVGRRGLTRDRLVNTFLEAGAEQVRSVLATGNVLFRPPATGTDEDAAAAAVITRVGAQLEEAVGLGEPIFLRPLAHLQARWQAAPFAGVGTQDVYERCVTFLPDGGAPVLPALPIRSGRGDVEIFALAGCEVFSVTRLVNGRPGSPGALIERLAGVRVTTRNWQTIGRLLRPAAGAAGSADLPI